MTTTLTTEQRTTLIKSALDARSLSYSPYSQFRVGAAILCRKGGKDSSSSSDDDDDAPTIVQGANVENASYGATICAERTAIVKAVMEGHCRGSLRAVAVASDRPDDACSPCGICRQFLREFCALDVPVWMPTASWSETNDVEGKSVTSTTLGALLPMSFGPEDLERK